MAMTSSPRRRASSSANRVRRAATPWPSNAGWYLRVDQGDPVMLDGVVEEAGEGAVEVCFVAVAFRCIDEDEAHPASRASARSDAVDPALDGVEFARSARSLDRLGAATEDVEHLRSRQPGRPGVHRIGVVGDVHDLPRVIRSASSDLATPRQDDALRPRATGSG